MSEQIAIQKTAGQSFDAHLFLAAGTRRCSVVLFPAVWGLDTDAHRHVLRLVDFGCDVLVPDVFWRVDPGVLDRRDPTEKERGLARMAAFDYAAGIEDSNRAFDLMRERASGNRVVAIGFCFGGLFPFTGAVHRRIDGGAAFHPTGIGEHLEGAGNITCPLALHFGAEDSMVPMAEVERIRSALAQTSSVDVVVHPGAGHGFMMDGHDNFEATAARIGWKAIQALVRPAHSEVLADTNP